MLVTINKIGEVGQKAIGVPLIAYDNGDKIKVFVASLDYSCAVTIEIPIAEIEMLLKLRESKS